MDLGDLEIMDIIFKTDNCCEIFYQTSKEFEYSWWSWVVVATGLGLAILAGWSWKEAIFYQK